MPASMIRAPTGGSPKVIGSSIAMVATDPMPGSTPIRVPTRAPMPQNRMFIGEKATPKPRARFARRSDMVAYPERELHHADAAQQRPEYEPQEIDILVPQDDVRIPLRP